MMIQTQTTIDLYLYYQTSTEYLKGLCIPECWITLRNTIFLLFPVRLSQRTFYSSCYIRHRYNAIQANMNQGLYSCGVFIDLKKAFDNVDHNILLDKLNFNFRGLISQWFSSYLNNCTQTTQIADHITNKPQSALEFLKLPL